MAIYSCSARTISRKEGRSATASAAYRSGSKITDERTGVLWDFTKRRGVLHSEITLPDHAPKWAADRSQLWNAAEAAEDKSTRRAEAKVARDFIVALPHELTDDERLAVTRTFSRFLVDRYAAAIDFAIHAPDRHGDNRNFHAHVLMSTRALGEDGFGAKLRSLDSPKSSGEEMAAIREAWETIANDALEKGGHESRIDRRSLEAQGIDREATIHMGVEANSMERRGEPSDRGNLNREIEANNTERTRLKAEHVDIQGQIIDLDAERAKRQEAKEVRREAATLDPDRILASLTDRRATFTRYDINRALAEFLPDPKARGAYTDAILDREGVVPLRENEAAPVSRYTTRDVLNSERQVSAAADRMEGRHKQGVSASGLQEALDRNPILDREQRDALNHATRSNGLAIIAGEAGTGKSTTFGAIRDAYEADGYRVLGMSWKNDVVQDMRRDGFRDTSTIAAELMRQNSGHGRKWDSRTVLMVDEAAMISTKHLAAFMNAADTAGAKVILAGDGKQLASIEAGGMFDVLQRTHGAAELHTVRRNVSQADAFNAMHRGDFRAAVETFDKAGAIKWSADPETSRAALVDQWARDTAAEPSKTRFALAFTNTEADDLNLRMRAVRKERGELGDDHRLNTTTGPQDFAAGDRVVFGASGRTKADRDRGFYNGSTGTVLDIVENRMTVQLDGAKQGQALRELSFNVGTNAEAGEYGSIKHHLAGTVYKSQGRTLDQSYVLHSDQWRIATSYVAMSRHRENLAIFAAEKSSPWMHAEGGLAGLTDKQREQAEQSYSAWTEAKPDAARRYGIADYVDYVQERAAEEQKLSPLDRLADQMGRVEERRAASDFVQGTRPVLEQPATTIAADLEPAADEVTKPRKPPLSIAAQIVGDYLELCYNPAKDWVKWIAEDLKERAAGRRDRLHNNNGGDHAEEGQSGGVAESYRVRGDTLRELQGRMDQDGTERRASGVPSGSGADLAGDDALRSVRAEDATAERAGSNDAGDVTNESASDYLSRRLRDAEREITERDEGPDRVTDRTPGRDRSFGRDR